MADLDPTLASAARYERDRRGENYPPRIAAREIDAEPAAIDYQCWTAIAEWLETGNFQSFSGGADPEGPDAPLIRWPELEAAAEAALVSITAKCDKLLADGGDGGETFAEACARRARLFVIHRKVQLRRQMVDSVNREFRAMQVKEIAA